MWRSYFGSVQLLTPMGTLIAAPRLTISTCNHSFNKSPLLHPNETGGENAVPIFYLMINNMTQNPQFKNMIHALLIHDKQFKEKMTEKNTT